MLSPSFTFIQSFVLMDIQDGKVNCSWLKYQILRVVKRAEFSEMARAEFHGFTDIGMCHSLLIVLDHLIFVRL